MKPNLPTPKGRALGAELARLCDHAAAARPDVPPRCATCAFRAGTLPNGCPPTLMDAVKCAAERIPFYCHERPEQLCAGFRLMVFSKPYRTRMPWPFSNGSGA